MTRRTETAGVLDGLALAAVTAALSVLSLRVGRSIHSPADAALILSVMAAGYLLADLLTGLVHWFCDTFFDEKTPVIGASLIAPFREHHRDPLLMTRHGFLELTGSSFRGLAPLIVLFVWQANAVHAAISAFVLATAAGTVVTNLFHRWAHEPSPPALARHLQRLGVVLTPERHVLHHEPPYAAAYCVTTGWMNPFCERLKIWSRAEAALIALGVPSRARHD